MTNPQCAHISQWFQYDYLLNVENNKNGSEKQNGNDEMRVIQQQWKQQKATKQWRTDCEHSALLFVCLRWSRKRNENKMRIACIKYNLCALMFNCFRLHLVCFWLPRTSYYNENQQNAHQCLSIKSSSALFEMWSGVFCHRLSTCAPPSNQCSKYVSLLMFKYMRPSNECSTYFI